ncbi:MAG TPA: carboxypeptidase-like regulatory domain-containing protein [Blastocatellia bacterium]|nr:carboxypeptidase-like regulatory domain-containing protein [Blastocatellia bacterium]
MKLRLMGFVLIAILASALTTLAQVAKMEGTVTGKGADGKVVPIEGATVDIVRVDIKGQYTVTTDKKGNYIHTGIPYSGTYWVIVSAPGWQANAVYNVQPERPPRNDIQLVPGNGHRPTYDEIVAATKAAGANGGKNAAPDPKEEAERKKKEEENRKSNENFEAMKKTFEEGLEFSKKGGEFLNKADYPNAIQQYKLAADKYRAAGALDSDQQVIFSNLALTLKNLAVAEFNSKNRDAAQKDFKDSAEAAKVAIGILDKKPDEKDYLTNSIGVHEVRVESLFILGDQFQDQDALKDAVTEYSWLAGKYGVDTKKASIAYSKIGDVQSDLMDRDAAQAAYDKALSLNPKNAYAYLGMAMLKATDPNADVAKYKEGVELAKKAKSVAEPNSKEAQKADETIKGLEETIATMDDSKNAAGSGKKKKP